MGHKVREYMVRTLSSVGIDDSIEDVIRVMYRAEMPVFPVVDEENKFLGTIYSETILKNIIPEQYGFLESHRLLYGVNQAAGNLKWVRGRNVKDFMSSRAVPVKETDDMDNVAETMLANKEAYLFVVNEEGKLRGYILRGDLLYYLLEVGEAN